MGAVRILYNIPAKLFTLVLDGSAKAGLANPVSVKISLVQLLVFIGAGYTCQRRKE